MSYQAKFSGLLCAALLLLAACGATPAPTALPTAAPTAPIVPTAAVTGDFQPLPPAECDALQQAAATKLGVEGNLATAPFQDYIGGGSGTGCLITLSGTGANFPSFMSVAADLQALLEGQGWTLDPMYAADGPTGTAYGLHKDTRLALVSVMWSPSSDANCPNDKPISECQLRPEQMLYTITLRLALK